MKADAKSLDKLKGVHPELIKVVLEVFAETTVPFRVTYGVRTLEEEIEMIRKGLSSLKDPKDCRHVPTGYPPLGHAVDISILDPAGKPVWSNQYIPAYIKVGELFQAASKKLRIPIRSGYLWKSFKDWGHHELPAKYYP